MFDGVGDFLHGLFGATAYRPIVREQLLMAITRSYSGPALLMAR